ncbi:MAG TPA: DUF2334 domain-containing protein, partial [Elusimicrobiota bacterium]|nr:DUF2334 domain-containing protein [Elusimicrobiota bacterium]
PPDFLSDAAAYRGPFLWLGWDVGQLQGAMGPDAFSRKTGFLYRRVEGFDAPAGPDGIPGFYRFVDYKGKRFTKLAFRRSGDGSVVASPEMTIVSTVSARVLASAVRSTDGAATPYVTLQGKFFYVADDPFVYIYEQDRYLVLADLLFDFLDLPPRSRTRYAVLRLEDIHPDYDVRLLYQAVDLLRKRRVPFAISLIPDYVAAGAPESSGTAMTSRPEFLRALRYAVKNGGVILLHGYTHNAPGLADCPSQASGYDYEFWDRCAQSALPGDSAESALARIAKAQALAAAAGFSPVGWVTPHYTASPVDFEAFGRIFDRTIQRVRYAFDGAQGAGAAAFVAQFFPYTIYKDHYGQFVWPENLGYVPMPESPPGDQPAPDIAAAADLSWVVRDGWASFYWHPQLLDRPGERERLERIIDAIRARGYRFVSLKALRDRGE